MDKKKIPEAVVRRLPVYLRYLTHLKSNEIGTVSSNRLGNMLDINPAQIRKDLAYFGAFGQKGIGYDIELLIEKIKQILKLNQQINIVLIGAGNLGHAISNYKIYLRDNLKIAAIFDSSPDKIGQALAGIPIQPMHELKKTVKKTEAKMGLITVPADAAQDVAYQLTEAGMEAILNFAPIQLKVPKHVKVLYMDLTTELQRLAYYL